MAIIILDLALHIWIYTSKLSISGWFEGKILYFNTQNCVDHILFTDGTTDYVADEDFDSIDLILL